MKSNRVLSDHQVEGFIGNLLRIGVITAACIVAAGGIFYLSRRAGAVPRYAVFQGEPDFLERLGKIFQAAFSLRSEAIIQLGLLVLIAVPIARVAVSVIAFLLRRDWLYCGVTILVLAVLMFSLLGGNV